MRSSLRLPLFHLLAATSTVFVAVLFACSSSSDSSSPAQGTEGGACYGNNSCNAGLTCASNLCVNLGMDAAAATDSSNVAPDAGAADTSVGDAADGAPPPWTPGSLANLTLWVEGDKGITVSTGNVTAWADQSTGHHDMVGTGTITTAPLNGIPCVVGTNNGSLIANVTLANGPMFIEAVTPQAHAGAAVSFRNQTGSEFGIVPNQDALSRNVFIAMLRQNEAPGLRTPDPTLALLESPHFVAALYDGDKTLALRVDGNQVATMAAATTVITAPIGAVTFGLFDNSAACELVFVAGTPPAADIAKLDSYLKAKYGL